MVFFIKSHSYETFVASRPVPKRGPFNREMSMFLMTLYIKKFYQRATIKMQFMNLRTLYNY